MNAQAYRSLIEGNHNVKKMANEMKGESQEEKRNSSSVSPQQRKRAGEISKLCAEFTYKLFNVSKQGASRDKALKKILDFNMDEESGEVKALAYLKRCA